MFTTATAVELAGAPDPSSGVSLGYHGSGPPGEWAVKALWFASPGFDQPVTISGRDQAGVDESEPYPQQWLCHYPHSKALAEQEVLAASGQAGLATCALRPHLIWGPRDQHLIPRLLARARNGQLRRVGNGRNLIDTVYVENAAAAEEPTTTQKMQSH